MTIVIPGLTGNLELLRLHGREEQHVLDGVVAGHEHGEAVDADADTRGDQHLSAA